LKPDPAQQVDPGPRAGTGRVEEKIEERKTRCARRVDPTRLGQKPGCNSLIFVFFLKRYRFDF